MITLLLLLTIQNTLAKDTPSDDSHAKRRCAAKLIEYPKYPAAPISDTVHGTEVPDPYRGLEDTTSEATQNWVNAQNRLTSHILTPTMKVQKKIIEHFKSFYNEPQVNWLFPDEKGQPSQIGKYFYYKIVEAGLTPNWAIVRTNKKEIGSGEILISSAKWGGPIRHLVTLRNVEVIQDGKFMVYEVNKFGSDWTEFFVIDLATGKHAPDDIKWTKGSISYSPDEKGCLYTQYEQPDQKYIDGNRRQRVKYHVFGTPTSQDQEIYFDPKLKMGEVDGYFNPESGEIIIYRIDPRHRGNSILTRDIDLTKKSEFKPLIPHELGADFQLVSSTKDGYLCITNHDAKNRKLIWIPKTAKSPSEWETIVPESKTAGYLESIQAVKPFLIMSYVNNAVSVVNIHKLDGTFVETMPSPGPGTIHSFRSGGKPGIIVFTHESLVDQGSLYGYGVGTKQVIKLEPDNPQSILKNFVYEHTTYKSSDGTDVPIQLLYHKDRKRDGNNAVYLHAYGGFGVNSMPEFNSKLFIWAQLGGVVAIPNIRGGAEMGGQWHSDGSLINKQNSFNDFIAAAEWLVKEGWTQPQKIGIEGGSNGGLLVGATLLQRPDLIGAAIPVVGVYDMIRFHKFTRGFHWINEYGSLRSREEFLAMLKYSPVHNVKPGVEYPPTLIATGNKDDRVSPIHSYKFAAALQAAQKGTNPILLRINANSAHGPGTRLEYVKQTAEEFAFFIEYLGMLTEEEKKTNSEQTPQP